MKIDLSGIDALITRANTLLKEGSYQRPVTVSVSYTYLSLNRPRHPLRHWYCENGITEEDIIILESIFNDLSTLVVHGHKVGAPCDAPSFCHEYGFRPDLTQYPAFHRVFYLKWDGYRVYDKRQKDMGKR